MSVAAITDAPWLQTVWQQLSHALQSDRLPHGVLLGGAAGSGHELIGERLLQAALCLDRNDEGDACGNCRSCYLRQRGSHEDMHRIELPEDRKSLSVEQVRELSEQLSFAPQRARRRVALIQPAEAMTVAASNALLKTLEEPPAAALLILVTGQPRSLLPTLRSRCGQWLVRTPEPTQAQAWVQQRLRCSADEAGWRLARNGDAVLAAVSDNHYQASLELAASLYHLLRDPQSSAAELVKREKSRLALLIEVTRSVLSLSAKPSQPALPEAVTGLLGLTRRIDSSSLLKLARELWQAQRWSGTGVREDLQVLGTLASLRKAASDAELVKSA